MPVEPVYRAEISRVSILDEHGRFDGALGADLIPDADVVALYEHMLLCRTLDEIAFKLQRSGRMGTYPQNMGQEAASLGAAYALDRRDWMVTCYRENAGLFWHGVPPELILLHWMGDERGNHIPADVQATPISIPIGTQMLHAAGLAWAEKLRKTGAIACTFFGDGATSEGDFHEAANFAANLDLPVIFVCQNNGWAISVPSRIQSSAPTFAQRGLAYGMESIQVDGNDLFAVVYVMRDAIRRAREQSRPTFIEAVTYRLRDHTTADDARRYRDAEELAAWEKRDPLVRLRGWLESRRLWSPDQEAAAKERSQSEVNAIVARAEGIAAPAAGDFFNHMYAELPDELRRQRDTMRTSSLGQDPSECSREPSPPPSPAHAH
ncbi:MAG: pyruvate dehydrogenase (acetyl-transferring) E1 component subunit alpha [Phycisphaeraceae bacterium]|nr:pyruvate dehydrogenase (acetyl-transferring) E1 component subunit alpha [Phycisphaeraceae bacterium]